MEHIGSQVKLPMGTAVQIALQGIKIRLGRALVTISGVVLGIAFLMSVVTGELINGTGIVEGAVVKQKKTVQTVKMMESFVKSEIGSAKGKIIGVVVVGELSKEEQLLLRGLVEQKPAELRAINLKMKGATLSSAQALGADSELLLVLGDAPTADYSLVEMTQGMKQQVVLDSFRPQEDQPARSFQDKPVGTMRVEPFFGATAAAATKAAEAKARSGQFRTLWIMIISLLVTVIGITNSLLMSVTERFKEIGTMKCLGALSAFIRQLFLIESALIGFVGSFVGVLLGALIPMLLYSIVYTDPLAGAGSGFKMVFGGIDYAWLMLAFGISVVVGTGLSIIAAIYPANFAARMVPAMALRSNV